MAAACRFSSARSPPTDGISMSLVFLSFDLGNARAQYGHDPRNFWQKSWSDAPDQAFQQKRCGMTENAGSLLSHET